MADSSKIAKAKNIALFLTLGIGLIFGAGYYKQSKSLSSSASIGNKTLLIVDPASCASEPLFSEYRFIDKQTSLLPNARANRYLWWERRAKGTEEELHRSPNQEQGTYTLLTLGGNGKKTESGPFQGLRYLPSTIEIDNSCEGVYLYKCVTEKCILPPSGKGPQIDLYREWNELMSYLGFYPATGGPHNIFPLLSPGKYLLTPFCDESYFPCGQ